MGTSNNLPLESRRVIHPEISLKPPENRLLASLPHSARTRIVNLCNPVELAHGDVLSKGGEPIRRAYFLRNGVASLLSPINKELIVEVGMVGNEGMIGAQVAVGTVYEPIRAVIQSPGTAWCIDTDALDKEVHQNTALREAMGTYLHLSLSQLAMSAACLRFHQIAPRLARWMLMAQDRLGANRIEVTHESLATLLGVRRVGITTAAAALQAQGIVEYHRGQVTILDRQALSAAACSCYAAHRKTTAIYLRNRR